MSDVADPYAYNAKMNWDISDNKLTETGRSILHALMAILEKLIITFAATLIIEGIVFKLYRFKFSNGNNLRLFVLTNLGTQIFLYACIEMFSGAGLIAEIVIPIAETVIY